MKFPSTKRRKAKNLVAQSVAVFFIAFALIPLLSILLDIFIRGVPQFSSTFFTADIPPPGNIQGGIGPAIVGSLMAIFFGSIIGIPLGVLSGIYVSEYGNNLFGRFVRFMTEVLSGFPSIVIGIFAYLILVVTMQGVNAIAGGFALSIIMIPVISRSTEESLKLVPISVREASLALGIPKWKTITKVVLAHGKAGIITGIVLSMARIAGESAPLLLTVGWTTFYPQSFMEPIATLPVLIYQFAISPYDNWHNLAWGAAAFLVLLILALNITVRLATRNRLDAAGRS